ncbi:hypothetical protein PSN45_000664 [Yamadazyma tenuis]|uniref:Globin domain-containing protein n=1 Tax=Candida tenuis (strain ATCC 10573 / BCRC 21748 / CBS 615 / JCM 9827 / NBRC 10315 / NRRL Y-1498 / VKM Y-70) TaxID=590646 RepID=G3B9S4_CANTC|nr:uncharacterized protein CANTEDRAFT_94836 [Yamadazyma tenuis ATCC 10573]EGV61957.1 hypothetical protein CANTEDRAFT_94836 [Yamadazyma tenuis ATCC 10573]WEJ93203.1 hypothetical protein PSN45_000664 [Yamadazyma tenuis]
MTLCLSKDDLHQVRACWNNVQANNKYHKDQFITRLFSNLLAANSSLKSFFSNDLIVREHSLLFNDLLNYSVLYLDNVERLNQFLNSFLKTNNDVVRTIDYLEPMGTALVQTFRQWLGKGIFNDKMEQLWVQIYIHLANIILVFSDDSDASSVGSESEVESESESVEEIPALNIARNREPKQQEDVYTPMTPVSPILQQVEEEEEDIDAEHQDEYSGRPIDLSKKPSIQINLRSNDKYRGFRRNDSSVVEIEPVLPARSPMRQAPKAAPTPALSAKFNNLKSKMVYDSDEEEEEKGFGFDPRKSNKKRSVFQETMEQTPPPPIEKDFHPVEEVEEYDLDEKPSDLDITLQPIVETSDNDHFNDNSSSIYNSDNSEPSSQENTLSLHSHYSHGTEETEPMSLQKVELTSMNSNEYRSDTSVENARVFSKTYDSRQTSISSVEPEFMASINAPKSSTRFSSRSCMSQTDLSLQKSIQSSQRASLGFMRSSFILKKEVEELGFNQPENVFAKPPTIPAALSSTTSLPQKTIETPISTVTKAPLGSSSDDESYDLLNTFMPITKSSKAQLKNKKFTSSCTNLSSTQPRSHPHLARHSRSVSNLNSARHNNYDPLQCTETTAVIRGHNSDNTKGKVKRSFTDKLRSLFGASHKPQKSEQRTISSPIETTYSTNSTVPAKSRSSMSSVPGSSFSKVSRISTNTSVDQTRSERESLDKFSESISSAPKKSFSRRHSRMSSVTDLRSINTVESSESTSGFSFFDRKSSTSSRYTTRGERKKNKYNVTKTPYDVFSHNKLVFSN